DLGDGSCRFICSIPSRALVSAAPGDWSERGVLRDCRPAKSIAEIARALGGIVLTPAAWAGLDGVPSAHAAFLLWLDERLKAAPELAGSLDREEPLSWTACDTLSGAVRWRGKGQVDGAPQLWRARHRWRGWIHAWTAGGAPSEQDFLRLHPDDGTRAAYAV